MGAQHGVPQRLLVGRAISVEGKVRRHLGGAVPDAVDRLRARSSRCKPSARSSRGALMEPSAGQSPPGLRLPCPRQTRP
jgi:hypothetical protein